LSIWKDYFLFFWRCRSFRRSRATDGSKTVFVVSMSNWIAQAKMEGLFVKSLEADGLTPVILTYRSCRWPKRYLRALGITRFIDFDVLMDAASDPEDARDVEQFLGTDPTFSSFLAYTYRGVRVGQHVLSTLVRRLRSSDLTFADPAVQGLLAKRMPESMRAARAAKRLFAEQRPHTVLFLEKGYTPYGEVFDSAVDAGCNVVQYLHSQRRDSFVLKRYSSENRRTHPFSLSSASWKRVKALPWTREQERAFMDELKSSYEDGTWFDRKYLLRGKVLKEPAEVKRELKLDPAKKTAVIYSHVLWDATFFFGENLFPDYEQWLIETVRVARENDRVNWVIKVHPDYQWKMKQLGETAAPRDIQVLEKALGSLPPHISIVLPDTDISTYSFFQITDYCITVRGTVGIEAPCFGIPVFTAGTGRYSGLGFTHDSATREEYLNKLRHIHSFGRLSEAETSLARRHAYALFMLRPLTIKSFEMVQMPFRSLGHPLDHNVTLRAKSADAFIRAEDLQAFREWILCSRDEDYLAF
jgi:hypothetical protein